MSGMNIKAIVKQAKQEFALLQIREEIEWAMNEIQSYLDLPVKVAVDLGSFAGGTAFIWSQFTDNDGLVICVDPCTYGAIPNVDKLSLATDKTFVHVRNNSEFAVPAILEFLDGSKIDILSIDTIHTAEQTQKEWTLYESLMNDKSVVIFHDIVTGFMRQENAPGYTGEPQFPTGEYWRNIKFDYHYKEMRMFPRGPDYGIGMLFLDNDKTG